MVKAVKKSTLKNESFIEQLKRYRQTNQKTFIDQSYLQEAYEYAYDLDDMKHYSGP